MKKFKKLVSITFLSLSLLALSIGTYAQGPFPGCDTTPAPYKGEAGCVFFFGDPYCDPALDPFSGEFACYYPLFPW